MTMNQCVAIYLLIYRLNGPVDHVIILSTVIILTNDMYALNVECLFIYGGCTSLKPNWKSYVSPFN